MFITLADKGGEGGSLLQVNHRPLQAIRTVGCVLAVNFYTLCEEARSQLGYIYTLSCRYHSVMLHNVPMIGPRKENAAHRFFALVDEFYECHVKPVITTEISIFEIYQGKQLKFKYQRCLSRLQEMQSEEYLKAAASAINLTQWAICSLSFICLMYALVAVRYPSLNCLSWKCPVSRFWRKQVNVAQGIKKSIQKLFDLCNRLLYNLMTSCYNKVFPKTFIVSAITI